MGADAALADYLAEACEPKFDLERARARASALLRVALDADTTVAERDRMLRALADDIGRDAPSMTLSATLAGALIEHGGSAEQVSAVLLPRLEAWVDAALGSLSHALEAGPPGGAPPAEDAEGDDDETRWVDERLANDPAWRTLHEVYLPCVAVLGQSAEARRSRAAMLPALQKLEPYHGGAAWLRQMLAVLDDERVVVIDVASRSGFLCTISGVASNFELFVLLAGALAGDPTEGWLAVPRPPEEVLRCLRGQGAQQTELTIEGAWNTYAYTALAPDLTLPEADDYGSSEHWIWGEGEPWEIPALGDTRIILLGPPSYVRLIPAQRTFATLRANVDAVRLRSEVVEDWLSRIARAGAN